MKYVTSRTRVLHHLGPVADGSAKARNGSLLRITRLDEKGSLSSTTEEARGEREYRRGFVRANLLTIFRSFDAAAA